MARLMVIYFVALMISGCSAFNAKLKNNWSESMNKMLVSYNDLLPYMYDETAFKNPGQKNDLEIKIARLNKQSQFVNQHAGNLISGKDPLMQMGITNLQRHTQAAYDSFREGQLDKSQKSLQHSINFCFQCHLSSQRGIEIKSWSQWSPPETMNPMQKAKALGATRQFSKAINELMGWIGSMESPHKNEEELISTMQILMQIGLYRNQNSQELSANLRSLMNQKNMRSLSSQTKSMVSHWLADLAKFKPLQKFNKMEFKALLDRDPRKNKFSKNSFVEQVKKSMIFRQGLSNSRFFDTRAKIFYHMGFLHRNFPIEGPLLSNGYFENCILLVASSKLSQKCYDELTFNFLKKYQVKNITDLPKSEQKTLHRLKSLAFDQFRSRSHGIDYYGR